MNAGATASIKNVWVCVLGAKARGLEVPEVCARLSLDPALMSDPDSRVPAALTFRAFEEVPQWCQAEDFGLAAARQVDPQRFDVIDYVAQHCQTLGDVLRVLLRYQRLMHDLHVIQVETSGDVVHLTHRFDGLAAAPRHFSEFLLAIWHARLSRVAGERVELCEVAFQHAAPANTEALRSTFQAPLRFSAPLNALTFSAATLQKPVPRADPQLGMLLERHAAELLARLPPLDELRHNLRNVLIAELENGVPSLEAASRKMAMSARTLQRRLQDEGTTYQDFVDDVRRELALTYVQDSRYTLTDVVFRLGFAESSSFHRSFKRWTGTTPAKYRKEATVH